MNLQAQEPKVNPSRVPATSGAPFPPDSTTQRQAIAVALGLPVKDVRLDLEWQRSVVVLEKKPEPLDTSAELEGNDRAI